MRGLLVVACSKRPRLPYLFFEEAFSCIPLDICDVLIVCFQEICTVLNYMLL